MKKIIVKFLLLLSIFVSFQGSCSKVGLEVETSNKSKTLKHNYIVLASVDGSAVEVEVSYSVFVAGNSENIVKTETLTTPFVIGGEDVKVVYDSVVAASDKHFVYNELKRNYTPKGADYLEIKNLSNVDLEYCVVGNQSLKYYTTKYIDEWINMSNRHLIDKSKVVKYSPTPIYKAVPVLFLLKPELAPQIDVYIPKAIGRCNGISCSTSGMFAKLISLKAPILGEMTATAPFSIPQIMGIYRQEYTKGYTLFRDYDRYTTGQISSVNESLISSRYNDVKHYGVIPSNQTLANSGQIWFINTHQGFYGNKMFEEYGE
ncbi:hypothetical protein [Capnocytophaga canis]|uniref:Uncharacterized protein n=1 Tax=Capnocytophaga canis TaxID=1848903 RepID=A0A3A1YPA9_9FLAO|nr:hypothetical protein [Capnocytophaga canis]RIY38154.1 hypothetical protein CKY20_00995 [Capnocytophaga canis]GIM60489.1 hypothetical protein CAPN008_05390 [Capnocytophaga canis]